MESFLKIGKFLLKSYVYIVLIWVLFALSVDVFFVSLDFSGNEKLAHEYSKKILWKIDGNFSK